MRKTAQTREEDFKTGMQKITYADMHCDTLTASCDKGLPLRNCGLQTDLEKLKKSGCIAQCFAIFTQGAAAAEDYERYLAAYLKFIGESGAISVKCGKDLEYCRINGITGAVLTVENLGFIGTDIEKIKECYEVGVRMASLVWNFENELAYPNLKYRDGLPRFNKREPRGLKEAGRQAIEMMDSLGIIVDISHLSDGGAEEILRGRKKPLVASHSDAAEICGVSRNLTDALIKKIADCGGAIGVNFCADFVGNSDIFAGICAHLKHIIDAGGEDVAAVGSDFDGIPAPVGLEDCTKMQSLFDYLSGHGFGGRLLHKLAYENFERVFKDVCGM